MSEKTLEQLIVNYMDQIDRWIEQIDSRLKLHHEQTVAAFKEMGFDFDKVKVRARVLQTDKPNAVDNARHLGPSADPIDWSAEPNLDEPVEKECLACHVPVFEKLNSDRYLVLVNSDGSMHVCVQQPFLKQFVANTGASVDGDPKQTPIKKYVSPVRSSDKAQRASGIVSAGGGTPEGDADGFYTDTDQA